MAILLARKIAEANYAEVFKTSAPETENQIMGSVVLLGLKIIDCATRRMHGYNNTFIIIKWGMVGEAGSEVGRKGTSNKKHREIESILDDSAFTELNIQCTVL